MKSKASITLCCILSNLLLGNGILYFVPSSGSENWVLMAGMSLACIISYFLLFRFVRFKTWNLFKLSLLSIVICFVIVQIGCSFASVFTGFGIAEYSFFAILKNFFIGFIMGVFGNLKMLVITIPMGIANVCWLRKYQQLQ